MLRVIQPEFIHIAPRSPEPVTRRLPGGERDKWVGKEVLVIQDRFYKGYPGWVKAQTRHGYQVELSGHPAIREIAAGNLIDL
jgi:hypothetical protein